MTVLIEKLKKTFTYFKHIRYVGLCMLCWILRFFWIKSIGGAANGRFAWKGVVISWILSI